MLPLVHPVPYRLLIFDLDGTLRRCKADRGPCHNLPGQWEVIPGVPEVLRQYDWGPIACGTATNQAGVALHYQTEAVMRAELQGTLVMALDRPGMTALLTASWLSMRYCPHAIEASCPCRKPAPKQLLDVVEHFGQRRDLTLFVGDSADDQGAAERAGVAFHWAWDFFGWTQPCNREVP